MKKTNTNFFFNGKKYYTNKKINIDDILKYFKYKTSILIVEHNNFIRHKKDWPNYIIKNNDKIEIIGIVGGG